MAKTLGNDVASFQGDINYDVYKNNSQFIICKATEGTGFKDPKFSRNQSEARRVGLPLGYYHFARPDLGNSPESEAQWFLTTIGQLKDGELLVLDYEPANQVQSHVDWCKKWLDYVQDKTKVKAFIYLNQSQVKKFNWQTVISGDYALWIAAYTFDPNNNNFVTGQWPGAAMQQWTNAQQVPGIPVAKTDGNVFFGDVATLKKYGYVTPSPPQPQPQPPTFNDQTKIPANLLNSQDFPVTQDMEIQAIRGTLADFGRTKKQLDVANKKINDAKAVLG